MHQTVDVGMTEKQNVAYVTCQNQVSNKQMNIDSQDIHVIGLIGKER